MEKLIDLLNEYEKTLEPNLQIEWTEVWIKSTPEIVISKKFWFIKWLVDNDKIDRDKSKIITAKTEIVLGMNFTDVFVITKRYWLYEQLLMLLAIQDEPINFLISILK